MPAIRAAVAAVARATGATAYGVAGQAPAGYDVGQASDTDLLHIVPVAIIAIAILLALVLRSLIAPVYLIASVAISYLASFGVSVLLFQDATGTGGLNYFIWLMTRFTTPDEIFGPISVTGLRNDEYRRITTGKAPVVLLARISRRLTNELLFDDPLLEPDV